jgi:glycosyltransferase involved in cell wall biosynthesis
MAKWNEFNVMPGMTTWIDMPPDYKKQYYIYQEKIKKRKDKTRKETEQIKKLTSSKTLTPIQVEQIKKAIKESKVGVDAHLSNMLDEKFFADLNEGISHKDGLKKILLISDVRGWAWWNKSQYLKHYLYDEFNIDIINVIGPGAQGVPNTGYDLYFTYGFSYIDRLKRIPKNKKMTGVTAHRPENVIRPAMNKTNHVHANSIMLLEEVKKFNANVHYVPNGVDENLFRPIKPITSFGELMVGHVGKKCKEKGQSAIIKPAIEKAGASSYVNTNDYRNKLPYCQMWQKYQDFDVFIVASDEDGTPNPALEAAACGRPIISNRIGNMPEFIIDGYNGFLVEKNINAYVEKIKWCMEHKDKVAEMGENARKTVLKEWTWKNQSEKYRKMFREVTR